MVMTTGNRRWRWPCISLRPRPAFLVGAGVFMKSGKMLRRPRMSTNFWQLSAPSAPVRAWFSTRTALQRDSFFSLPPGRQVRSRSHTHTRVPTAVLLVSFPYCSILTCCSVSLPFPLFRQPPTSASGSSAAAPRRGGTCHGSPPSSVRSRGSWRGSPSSPPPRRSPGRVACTPGDSRHGNRSTGPQPHLSYSCLTTWHSNNLHV